MFSEAKFIDTGG